LVPASRPPRLALLDSTRSRAAARRRRSTSFTTSPATSTCLPATFGFWQGVYRDPETPEFAQVADAVTAGERLVIDVLYGDHRGGQRAISRFRCRRPVTADGWSPAARHWNIDRDDPR
jgi:hypothetical protein